eukprot:5267868-Amphidinium_carterae.1
MATARRRTKKLELRDRVRKLYLRRPAASDTFSHGGRWQTATHKPRPAGELAEVGADYAWS